MSTTRVNHWIARLLAAVLVTLLAACSGVAAPTATLTEAPTEVPTSTPEPPTDVPPTMTSAPTSEPTSTIRPTDEATEEADEAAPEVTAESTGEAVAIASGDPTHGDSLFHYGGNGAPPCSSCHQTDRNAAARFSLGPNLGGVSERAGARIEGYSAEEYIHQSIVDPRSFLVPGFRNSMFPRYAQVYSEQDIADLIAYLLTL